MASESDRSRTIVGYVPSLLLLVPWRIAFLAHGLAAHFDAVGVVNQTAQDAIGDGAIAEHANGAATFASAVVPSLLGAVFAFLAGLLALKWLSRWLESGRWYLFGVYCLIAAMGVGYLHHLGY